MTNVIPGSVEVLFNLRFSTEVTADEIRERCEAILNQVVSPMTLMVAEWRALFDRARGTA